MSLVHMTMWGESRLKWRTVFSYTTPLLESPRFWLQNRKCFFQLSNTESCYHHGTDYFTRLAIKDINASAPPDLIDLTLDIKTSSKEWIKTRLNMRKSHSFRTFLYTQWRGEVLPGPEEMTLEVIFHGDVGSTVRLATEEDNTSSLLSISDPEVIFSQDFSKLFGGDFFHGVEIKCGEHTFKAHRNILSCRSEVFLAMLQSDMVEGQTTRLNIKDMDLNVCKEFLQFLYSGKIPELALDIARGLYEAADNYKVGGLMKPCAEFLTRNLTDDNALEMLVLADIHSDAIFKGTVIKYILDRKLPLQDDIWQAFNDCQPKLSIEVLTRFYRSQHSK